MVIIDKIFEILFGVILIFFVPIMLLFLHMDQTTQTYANDIVEEFINKSCASSIITSSSYEDMVNSLDATGITYDIYLVHEKEQVEPKTDEDGDTILNSFAQYHEEYRGEEIFDTLFPNDGTEGNQSYYLNYGDYIRVVVENNTPTIGRRFFSIFNLGHTGKSILVSYGGYVGNEITDRNIIMEE